MSGYKKEISKYLNLKIPVFQIESTGQKLKKIKLRNDEKVK